MKTEPVTTLEHSITEKLAFQEYIEDLHDLCNLVTLFTIATVPHFLPKNGHTRFFWRQWRPWEVAIRSLFFFARAFNFQAVSVPLENSVKLTSGKTKTKHFTYRGLIQQELYELNKLKLWQPPTHPKKTPPQQMTKVLKLSHFLTKIAWNQMGFPKDIWSYLY